MTGALIILAVTILTGAILYLTRDKGGAAAQPQATQDASNQTEESSEVCCGRHAVCEKSLPAIEELYYDDEELDRYAGREPEAYTTEEIEDFREVLYTLRPDDVYRWGISLTQRNVPLPIQLRDEWIMLCETRSSI